jgi:ATP-dependent Clp protease adaptor protein ClpS
VSARSPGGSLGTVPRMPAEPGCPWALVAPPAVRPAAPVAAVRSRQVETAPPEAEPSIEEQTDLDESPSTDKPWLVIVWNDPINLMSFVTFVFQKLFGYSKEKATKLMLDVHHKGRAVVSSGTRERAELDVYRLHEYGLWATMEPST